MSGLSAKGHHLRTRLSEIGVEITPDELSDGIDAARERVQPGPDGCCTLCGRPAGPGVDFRCGVCDFCAFPEKKAALRSTGDSDE